MFTSYSAVELLGSGGVPSSLASPSALETQCVFSVPPPNISREPSCSVCSSCGRDLQGGPSTVVPSHLKLEEDRTTFALQLRAAAIFNKDVPPPIVAEPPVQLNVPPPPSAPTVSYPPPPPHHLSFTCFPPPTIVPTLNISYQVGGAGDPISISPSCTTSATSHPSISNLMAQTYNAVQPGTASPAGMKRMSDMDAEETPMKRHRPAGDTELKLLIQSKAAGSVIGKGGQNISRLRSENPASITVPDCPGPERVLTIGGSEDVVVKVLDEVLESLEEAGQKDGGDCDARILVHHSQAGCIIGKGGSKIKELRELCGGQVKVYSNCCPQSSDRVIQVVGERQRVLVTIGNILESLRDSPIKGTNSPYNPHNFDEFFSQDYGGWSDGPKGRFPPMGRGPPPMGPSGPMGRGPMGPSGPLGPQGPHFNRRGLPFPSSRGGPNSSDYDGFRGGKQSMLNGGSPQNGDPTTTQVTIPKEAAGAIIGKGGARIRRIRADSGASISIENSRPGCSDRIITITGADSQIKHAQYLLQQSVREFGGPSLSGNRRF